jgi:UDP-glucose 4-epimerase
MTMAAVKFLVTGGAGFIGSTFCDAALAKGHEVLAFDDLSTGSEYFLDDAFKQPGFQLDKGDIRDFAAIEKSAKLFQPDWVIHLAANADVRLGTERPRRDLDYNTIGTWNVLEAARTAGCRKFLFSSTGSVYGEPEVFPTPEDAPFPVQTSLYAASKIAGEGLISAYAYAYGMQNLVFRFVSILGPRYTHGHVFDFLKKLKKDPSNLYVLGNGLQTKSYLHIHDLMRGLFTAIDNVRNPFDVYNIGHDDALTVNQSIGYICGHLGLKPALSYAGGERGWVGDSPRIQLDTSKLKKLGWSAHKSLKDSVIDTVEYLIQHPELLERN